MSPPDCKCHGFPKIWVTREEMPSGGFWRCNAKQYRLLAAREKHREYNRKRNRRKSPEEMEKDRQRMRRRYMMQQIQKRGGHWCLHQRVVSKVVEQVQPNLVPIDISRVMNIDESAAGRLLTREWVSVWKLDGFLVAFGCEHLWHFPPLDQYKEVLLEMSA